MEMKKLTSSKSSIIGSTLSNRRFDDSSRDDDSITNSKHHRSKRLRSELETIDELIDKKHRIKNKNDESSSSGSSSSSENKFGIKEKLVDILNHKDDMNGTSGKLEGNITLSLEESGNPNNSSQRQYFSIVSNSKDLHLLASDFVKISRNEGSFDFYGQIMGIFKDLITKKDYIECKIFIPAHDSVNFDILKKLNFTWLNVNDSFNINSNNNEFKKDGKRDRKKELYQVLQTPYKIIPVHRIQRQIEITIPRKNSSNSTVLSMTRGRDKFFCRYCINFKKKIVRKLDGKDGEK